MDNLISRKVSQPLEVEEVMRILRKRWGFLYELKLVVKGKRLYLQIMWRFLEQQSFPFSEQEYRERLAKVIEIVNRINQSSEVRSWLLFQDGRPRVGRALSLLLRADSRLEEFLL